MITRLSGLALATCFLIPLQAGSQSPATEGSASPTSAPLKTAASFHEYLERGDSAKAAMLLAHDAVILESGDRETRAGYVAHHLAEDIDFAKTVTTTRTVVESHRQGNVAWIVSTSVSKGRFHERQIDSRGAELMVLTRSEGRWLIRAIHWSSRRSAP